MNKIIIILILTLFAFKQIIFANTKDDTYINSTNIQYDKKNNIVELFKNSKINIDGANILVDRGIIDYNNDKLEVFGNFYLYQDFNIISGKDLKGDSKLINFKANDVSYIYNNDLKIDSNNAMRSENIVYFYNNFLTPCEINGYFNCPTWSLRIDETKYNIEKDKFIHFDSFLQIADLKVFYIPYFSHYGSKAPRKHGFLTPTIQFVVGGSSGIKTPYYLPITDSADILFTPVWEFDDDYQFLKNYRLKSVFNQKLSGGDTNVEIDNIKYADSENINTTIRLSTKQILNREMIFSANGIFTNSISTTRSINEEPITFEEVFLRLEKYNLFSDEDYINTEYATIESFDESVPINQIPFSPKISYHSKFNISEKYSLLNDIDYRILNRNSSNINNPSENYILNLNNFLIFNNVLSNIVFYNKLSTINSINNYTFEHDSTLNREEYNSSIILSSDINFNYNKMVTPRIKIIHFQEIARSDNIINEDSNSISFNYNNQFSDKRLFGNDLMDNTSRIVYGIENNIKIFNQNIILNINQSYDINKSNNFSEKINQNSNFSDYSLELKSAYKKLDFHIDMRIDEDTLARKELNYSIMIKENPIDLTLSYYETNISAYKNSSSNTKLLNIGLSKELNNNIRLAYGSKLNLKNDYSPLDESLLLSIYDECTKLDINYSNRRFDDDYNTQPEEKISFTLSMDYLGYFGYEQTTDLLFEEAGTVNYGL